MHRARSTKKAKRFSALALAHMSRSTSFRRVPVGRQLRGLFVRSGLVHVDSRVAPLVFTSWADFQAVSGFSAELLRSAAGWGFATAEQIAALLSDFERRDAEGRFFACLVAMRCKGVRP